MYNTYSPGSATYYQQPGIHCWRVRGWWCCLSEAVHLLVGDDPDDGTGCAPERNLLAQGILRREEQAPRGVVDEEHGRRVCRVGLL